MNDSKFTVASSLSTGAHPQQGSSSTSFFSLDYTAVQLYL